MSYSCVEYTNNGRREMVTVPSLWVDTNEKLLYWPPTSEHTRIKKMMAEEVLPTMKWRQYGNAKVLFTGRYLFIDNILLFISYQSLLNSIRTIFANLQLVYLQF